MYILDAKGALLILPFGAPLPEGAHVATAEEVAKWQEADTVRSGAGIPAPKAPEQAAREHAALAENIALHGGVATPIEQANLEATAKGAKAPKPLPAATDEPKSVKGRGA